MQETKGDSPSAGAKPLLTTERYLIERAEEKLVVQLYRRAQMREGEGDQSPYDLWLAVSEAHEYLCIALDRARPSGHPLNREA